MASACYCYCSEDISGTGRSRVPVDAVDLEARRGALRQEPAIAAHADGKLEVIVLRPRLRHQFRQPGAPTFDSRGYKESRRQDASRCPSSHGYVVGVTEPSNARSALNLRLVLSAFGLILCGALSVLAARAAFDLPALLLALLALVALVDLIVVQRRRRREQRPGSSLFE